VSRPFFEKYDPVTTRYTEIVNDPETGLPLITTTQDVKPIVESAKRLNNDFQGTSKDDMTLVARIPMVIWQQLNLLGITRDEAALNAWLEERDNAVFRTDGRRRL
jgi:hypothetical protein